MEYQSFTAKTKEEAITSACLSFGVTSDMLDFIVDEEGASGFFGIGQKDAVIRARVRGEEPEEEKAAEKKEEAPKTAVPEDDGKPHIKTLDEIEAKAREAAANGSPAYEEKKERSERDRDRGRRGRRGRKNDRKEHIKEETIPVVPDYTPSVPKPEKEVVPRTEEEIAVITKDAEQFLTDVFTAMDIDVEKTIAYDAETGVLGCEFAGEEMGVLIGKRGQTLDALQYLTSLVVNKRQKEYVRVKLDTEEYRRRRKDTLESLAKNIARKVERSHRAVALEPMNPYERRIIHSVLQSRNGIETYSEGEEPYRRVVVTPKKNRD